MNIIVPPDAPTWMVTAFRTIENAYNGIADHPVRLQTFTVGTLPAAADWTQGVVYVSDDIDGAIIAFSDGVHWLRASDLTPVATGYILLEDGSSFMLLESGDKIILQ